MPSMRHLNFVAAIIMGVQGVACTPAAAPPSATPELAEPTVTPVPPTSTPMPSPTATNIPSPTPLPGPMVIPVTDMASSIPWLPLDNSARPGINMVLFNHNRPPFNNVLVRSALAHSIDRAVIAEMAERYHAENPSPATSLTPPQTLGRDLYGEIGAEYDPPQAAQLLLEAGYTDPSAFPTATFLVNASGESAPGARFNMANAMADMWNANLGITVEVEAVGSWSAYLQRIQNDPPQLFWLGWAADINDPDNFLRELFHSESEFNLGHFNSGEFDRMVEEAQRLRDPEVRQDLYLQAEALLTENEVGVIPIFHSTYNMP